jgi:predicted Zn-dependent peptidase
MTKMKIEFAPGAFDNFDGTQEELDELLAEIQRLADSGELLEQSTEVDIKQLLEDDPEYAAQVLASLERLDNDDRTLQ